MTNQTEKECGWCAKTFTAVDGQPDFCCAACYEAWLEAQEEAL